MLIALSYGSTDHWFKDCRNIALWILSSAHNAMQHGFTTRTINNPLTTSVYAQLIELWILRSLSYGSLSNLSMDPHQTIGRCILTQLRDGSSTHWIMDSQIIDWWMLHHWSMDLVESWILPWLSYGSAHHWITDRQRTELRALGPFGYHGTNRASIDLYIFSVWMP